MIWLYVVIVILFIILLFAIMKIYIMKKSMKEIAVSFSNILQSDTNTLIAITTKDKDIKKLANEINRELKKLRKQQLQYQNGNQELKRIITNISHDMRTPLTAIRGYIELLRENKEEQEKYLKIIDRKTNELTVLTEQLFDFSKTMDMETKIEKEECCLNELLEEALANDYTIFKENNIEPKVEICAEKIYRNLDKHTIIRIFENILSNAGKYSNGDFKVILDKEGKITFSNKATSLDATTVQKIFDRYFTVENAKKSTGLGLSIAKQLVELNGGNISAKFINQYLIIQIEF